METLLNESVWNNVAEVELVYKSKCKASERPRVVTSQDIYDLLLKHWDQNKIELQEQFVVLLLNTGNKVLGIYDLATGGTNSVMADPKLIILSALKLSATAMIVAHNHPSGSLRPSRQDEAMTEKIKHGAAFFDIKLLDHLIITNEGFYSFSDRGTL